jgi:hypothetical protein
MLNYDMYRPVYKPRTNLLKRAALGGMLLLSAYAGDYYGFADRFINPILHRGKPVRKEMYQTIDTLRLEKTVRDGVREVYLIDTASDIKLPVDPNMHVGRTLSEIVRNENAPKREEPKSTQSVCEKEESSYEQEYIAEGMRTLELIDRKLSRLFNDFYKWLEE